jgi:hypothetical protein
MHAIRSALIVCLTAVPTALAGQAPVADALRSSLQESQTNIVAAFREFPADKYGYKPTPAQLGVGEIALHLAGGNTFLCSSISGKERPTWPKLSPTAPKDTLIARLKASFDFCNTALATVDDSKLSEMVPWFGPKPVSRATAILGIVGDWADHYSQLANYLRLNGMLPPTAKKSE